MRSPQIRDTFLDYFTARGHQRVPSSSLIPSEPTLLLTNAGMNQFQPYYLGTAQPEYSRATSVQKCVRTSDIENVGRTTRHATFFEMLGNFAFGDYFKTEAIDFAHDLFVNGYGLDPARLWVTVYLDDDEAALHWRSRGVPAERIQRLGMKDNYWSMGVPGPAGPSSELCYDRGPAFGPEGGPAVNDERYIELWNLVFMHTVRGETRGTGSVKEGYEIVGELPRRNIDTGLGMDRLAMILQGVDTVCQTDLLAPTLRTVEELAGRGFPGRDGSPRALSFQVVAEHARTVAFLVADGVLPGNEGRGYVLRRLMRRVVRHARLLGIEGPVLPAVTASVVGNLGEVWPELPAQAELISRVVSAEEESSTRTLRSGSRLLDAAIERVRGSSASVLPGETAFELHDTFGFPVELTVEAARDAGLSVDEDRFAELLTEQRRRAQAGDRARTAEALRRTDLYRDLSARHGRTDFVGYTDLTSEGTVVGLIAGGAVVPGAGEGQEMELVLDRSPFYAEAGGQVGDTGTVRTSGGAVLAVTGTRYGLDGLHVHTAKVISGEVRTGEAVEASVDGPRRAAIARSHSATQCCTRCSAVFWATTPASTARWWRRGGCASTSRTSPRSGPSCCTRWRNWSTSASWTIRRCGSGTRAGLRQRRRARSRCSARSTARPCGSWTSATSPASSAAAPISPMARSPGR
ncbi:alanine--tRNA ligase [Spongiactinospora rosea]|uniref:alanine--tRNA ligase n=1 Tax=Spongiactinospora rosea TaxID=2248750 RepID=UPI001CEDCCD0|nr:alanine--tRNA ligase [Spongiactinospora rosea]